MNFDTDVRDDLQDHISQAPQEREISLGTSTILGIFLGLALLCAAFFGFGYSMGRKASLPPVAAADAPAASKKDTPFSSFKTTPAAKSAGAATSAPVAAETTDAAEPSGKTAPAAEPAAGDQPPPSSEGVWMVQVSVSTMKPDAEKLTGVLTRQGFPAAMQTGKDGKFHIRVGPFATKAAADTTRKMLVADGYKEPYISNH